MAVTLTDEAKALAAELGVAPWQVQQTIELLDAENTIWFVARYRKEQTGGLDEEVLQRLSEALSARRALETRRAEVMRLLEEQGNLSEELKKELEAASSVQRVDDLYRPFRPKRRTRAGIAREKGLAPAAQMILRLVVPSRMQGVDAAEALFGRLLPALNGVETVEEAVQGAKDIVAEVASDDPDVRAEARRFVMAQGVVVSERAKQDSSKDDGGGSEFEHYYDFRCALRALRPYQVLALDRGERASALKVRVEVNAEALIGRIHARARAGRVVDSTEAPPDASLDAARGRLRSDLETLRDEAIQDGFRRLLWPALEREARAHVTKSAHEHAIKVFGQNLRQLLLQPPIPPTTVMGIDPGYRAGCKVAVVSPTGELLATATLYPHPPQKQWAASVEALASLAARHSAGVLAVGNGTASHETQALASEVIARVPGLRYTVVSEAGASVYSASPLAREEFPDLDVTLRGAVSIARRLQDPLAELVKIDPRSIGVGLYQHDVDQAGLDRSLAVVVESCVNRVGVELNTASESILRRISGLSTRQASSIIAHRRKIGRFTTRAELRDVPGIGPKTFEQCAGFLRIAAGRDPLDATRIHPESYPVTRRLLGHVGLPEPGRALSGDGRESLRRAIAEIDLTQAAAAWGVGDLTLRDIADALLQPGRDPREELPPPLFRTGLVEIEDLSPGMVFQGRVANVVDFGAFVDIGLKQAGLVHVSEMADRFVRDPFDVVSVGDVVSARVISVDARRGRIALSLKGAAGDK